VGDRLQINRIVARLTASYLGVFLVVLAAISAGAYLFVLRSAREALEPLLALPEGRAALAATMHRVAFTIVAFDVPLVLVVGLAAYVLATLSVRPLLLARTREERFAADAAHELRTPLATIAALAQSRKPEALETIARIALEASSLLGDLLSLVREAPSDRRLHEPVDLARLARVHVETLRAAHVDGVAVTTDLPESAYVVGDEHELRRLLMNLCDNATRHAVRGIDVRVRTEAGRVVVEVEDDGPGVPPEYRDRVFDRFFKVDEGGAGSGLGLAICRRIAGSHGGDLVLEGRNRFVARFKAAS
jgi:signal transduction histidine kinase